jgi:hypothetical protein
MVGILAAASLWLAMPLGRDDASQPSPTGTSSPRPLPRPSPEPSPPHALELVDDVVRELDWGNIAYDPPPRMKLGEPATVELLLSPSASIAELQAQLDEARNPEGATVQVSNRMEAQLSGLGFSIEALTPGVQAITSRKPTRWAWDIQPTDHGGQRLHLALSAHIDVANRDTPLVVRTFDREIEVEITAAQRTSTFLENNWQWLWAAVLVPVTTFLWRRHRKDS